MNLANSWTLLIGSLWAFLMRNEMVGTSLFFWPSASRMIPASNQPVVTSVSWRALAMSTSEPPHPATSDEARITTDKEERTGRMG